MANPYNYQNLETLIQPYITREKVCLGFLVAGMLSTMVGTIVYAATQGSVSRQVTHLRSLDTPLQFSPPDFINKVVKIGSVAGLIIMGFTGLILYSDFCRSKINEIISLAVTAENGDMTPNKREFLNRFHSYCSRLIGAYPTYFQNRNALIGVLLPSTQFFNTTEQKWQYINPFYIPPRRHY